MEQKCRSSNLMVRGWEFIISGFWVLTHPLLPQLKILFCNHKYNGKGWGIYNFQSLGIHSQMSPQSKIY